MELNKREYRVELYDRSDGWNYETLTLIVNEAKGFCQIETDISRCKNSHGTDWDDSVTLSDPYTLEEMANYLERNYSPKVINAKSPDERECYNIEAYTHAPRLRAAATAYAAAQSGTENLLTSLLSPQEEVISSSYSDSSAVYHVRNKADRKEYYVKLSCVPKEQKAKAATVLQRLQQLQEDTNLVPIRKAVWVPQDSGHELLATWMPKLTPIDIQVDGSGKSHYESIDGFSGKGKLHQLGRDIAAALKILHGNGLVHHDVKPENIYYSHEKKHWCLGDFDSAKPPELQYQVNTTATIAFAAPEILKKQPYSYSCDVYSWGRTMLFLATGIIPDRDTQASIRWDGSNIALTAGSHSSYREVNAVNLLFYGIVARALSENPDERYPSAGELLKDLDQLLENTSKKPTPDALRIKFKQDGWEFPWVGNGMDQGNLIYVYNKARKNGALLKILADMKKEALKETRTAYAAKGIEPDQFDRREPGNQQGLMETTAEEGITKFCGSLTQPKLTLHLSPAFPQRGNATIFYILCRLSAIEGGYNLLHPQVTLEIQAPEGSQRHLKQLEKLVSEFFPWVQIGSKAAPAASKSVAPIPAPKPAGPKPPAAPPVTPPPAVVPKKKPGFFARLFGGKRAAKAPLSPQEEFYQQMKTMPAFRTAFSCAAAEINTALIRGQITVKNPSGGPLTLAQWQTLTESQQLDYILLLGNRGITPSVLLCIDFAEVIPYCLAIALLYMAHTGQLENQVLDTGDNTNSSLLKIAVESLLPCCPRWQCKIF